MEFIDAYVKGINRLSLIKLLDLYSAIVVNRELIIIVIKLV